MAKKKTKTERATELRKERMLKALVQANGIVTTACKTAKIVRATHYRWLEDDEEYCKAVESIDDLTAEFVEGQLMKLIKAEHPQSIMFYLKTKGKTRGWGSTVEITGDADKPIVWKETKKYKNDD